MQKKIFIKLTAVALLLMVSPSLACGEFCSTCEVDNTCSACFKSTPNKKGVCVDHQSNSTCLIKASHPNRCGWCRKGFSLDLQKGTCVQDSNPIPNCVLSAEKRGRITCLACENGHQPAKNGHRCVPYNTKAHPNCLWAGRSFDPTTGPDCARCRPGFSVGNGICDNFNATGCLRVIKGTRDQPVYHCLACDVFAGYYMKNHQDLSCVKRNSKMMALIGDF